MYKFQIVLYIFFFFIEILLQQVNNKQKPFYVIIEDDCYSAIEATRDELNHPLMNFILLGL
jgi:hypothetical protein